MKNVYFFGNGQADGSAQMKDTLGGKGANLHEMTKLGIPVPPGFTISADLCTTYLEAGKLPEDLCQEVTESMRKLETVTGRRFGDADDPLLVSVRSGAKFSMPGMMNTVLNLGLNDDTVAGLSKLTNNPTFANDSYRRFAQMYAEVVMDVQAENGVNPIDEAIEEIKRKRNVKREIDLDAEDLKLLAHTIKGIAEEKTGNPFPDDPWDQLWHAVEAVFRSWHTKRAIDYRRHNGIPDDLGTAVNVMTMVYGNMGEDSATGVVFTRDPATGEKNLFGEYLVNAQGEDVVAGIRTPEPIAAMANTFPDAHKKLVDTCDALERHYRDIQDMEFTIERGTLYLLQTRAAKRTAQAAIQVAVAMVDEGLITEQEAVNRVDPYQLDQLLHPTLDPKAPVEVLSTGLPASPGAAAGRAVFDADTAVERAGEGPVILVRRETNPDDFHGMVVAAAILTERGGMTSHAAVVARGMGKSCVSGCKSINVDEQKHLFTVDGQQVKEGDWITVDGSAGRVIKGQVPLIDPKPSEQFKRLMGWADGFRRLRVRTNADTPADSRRAVEFGAEGIGLCRTEHMFFDEDRIDAMREMIVAKDLEGRAKALAKLLPMQRQDFLGIFQAMDGFPVTIRLLDPPLHEFLPHGEEEIQNLAGRIDVSVEQLQNALKTLTEANPMLGHRGCRLGIIYPEITEMQAEAIFEAACDAAAEGVDVHPEVMVPLVGYAEELKRQDEVVREVAERVFERRGARVDYLVGTMIELPRAAITANEIAETAEFFSFGTNDLTQTTLGLSRDDAGRFLPTYVESGVIPADPFQTIDKNGVGELVAMGVERGRSTKPDLKVGICGEHGGDPTTVAFCHDVGLNYVSCSPFRVPIARLAAAQAALGDEVKVDTR